MASTTTNKGPSQPVLSSFLNTVCPGINSLDPNCHYVIETDHLATVDWPLSTPPKKAHLDKDYLNISRPPFNLLSGNESTTYVARPQNIIKLFKEATGGRAGIDGFQISANVDPLVNDPFHYVLLNPGCMSQMVDLEKLNSEGNIDRDRKPVASLEGKTTVNPFNKLSSNFNKLLKFSTSEKESLFPNTFITQSNTGPGNLVHKILDYKEDTYKLAFQNGNRLLVSTNVNVLNVIVVDDKNHFVNTKDVMVTKPKLEQDPPTSSSLANTNANNSNPISLVHEKKTIESALLRIQFQPTLVVTAQNTFLAEFLGERAVLVVLGFDSGDIFVMNLLDLSCQYIEAFAKSPVISLELISHQDIKPNSKHIDDGTISTAKAAKFLILAGYANGEVLISNPFFSIDGKYQKTVEGHDEQATYFKKFDLSPFSGDLPPEQLVGHFKISHKPITSISLTFPLDSYKLLTHPDDSTPLIVAFASDDGLVKFLDFSRTHEMSYGLPGPGLVPIITDILLNYFNDGITSICFSPDFRFFCIAGRGDLIEVFKMTYYNVNGIIYNKHSSGDKNAHGGVGKRSRSGTLNSVSLNMGSVQTPSSIQQSSTSSNISPPFTNLTGTPSLSFEMKNIDLELLANNSTNALVSPELHHRLFPSMIKEIKIVARFKGHDNSVQKVEFLQDLIENYKHLSYKIASCGCDSKVLIWEFDYKALPRRRVPISRINGGASASHLPTAGNSSTRLSSTGALPSPLNSVGGSLSAVLSSGINQNSGNTSFPTISGNTANISSLMRKTPSNPLRHHVRTKSMNPEDFMPLNSTLSSNIANALYKNLYDLRLKRHLAKIKQPGRFSTIIHPIVADLLIPLIDIPLISIDLQHWVQDGKIDGIWMDDWFFWVFAKNGDIFRYAIK